MIPLLVLVGAEHGAHAEEAGVAEDLGDGGVAGTMFLTNDLQNVSVFY